MRARASHFCAARVGDALRPRNLWTKTITSRACGAARIVRATIACDCFEPARGQPVSFRARSFDCSAPKRAWVDSKALRAPRRYDCFMPAREGANLARIRTESGRFAGPRRPNLRPPSPARRLCAGARTALENDCYAAARAASTGGENLCRRGFCCRKNNTKVLSNDVLFVQPRNEAARST